MIQNGTYDSQYYLYNMSVYYSLLAPKYVNVQCSIWRCLQSLTYRNKISTKEISFLVHMARKVEKKNSKKAISEVARICSFSFDVFLSFEASQGRYVYILFVFNFMKDTRVLIQSIILQYVDVIHLPWVQGSISSVPGMLAT